MKPGVDSHGTNEGGDMGTPEGEDRGAAGGGFGEVFRGLGSLFEIVSKMVEEGGGQYERTGELGGLGGNVKGVYGISVRVGLDGGPVVERFGNIRETEAGPEVAESREPIVDVFEEDDTILVIAELPGVEESDIQLDVRGDILELFAEAGDRRYRKEMLLPASVDAGSMASSYRNGVLEVRLCRVSQ